MRNRTPWPVIPLLVLFLFVMRTNASAAPADLSFQIRSVDFTDNGVTTKLDAPPYMSGGTTMVPMRAIFESLGYLVEYAPATRQILCTNGMKRLALTVGDVNATVDGVGRTMPVAPETVNGRTFVPLRFVSENSGATVKWVNAGTPVTVHLDERTDLGTFALVEKTVDRNRVVTAKLDLFRKGEANHLEFPGKEVTDVKAFRGCFLVTLLDPVKLTTEVAAFNGEWKTLLADYDVKEGFSFNGNLVVKLYNRIRKQDELWRFDGTSLVLIDSDFSMGVCVVRDDQVLISRNNSSRSYALMRLTTASWMPERLAYQDGQLNDFVIKDFIVDGDVVYMLGLKATGSQAWFFTYTASAGGGSLRAIQVPASEKVTLQDVFQTSTNIYVKLQSVLHVLTQTDLKPVEFADATTFVHVKLGEGQVIDGTLHAIVTGLVTSVSDVKLQADGVTLKDIRYNSILIAQADKTFMLRLGNDVSFTPSLPNDKHIPIPTETGTVRINLPLDACATLRLTDAERNSLPRKDDKINSMERFENSLYLLGVNPAGDSYVRSYAPNDRTAGPQFPDIRKIERIVRVSPDSVVMAVEEYNRLDGKIQKTLVELSGGACRNLAVGVETLQMAIKAGRLTVYGKETDTAKTRLFQHAAGNFNSIGSSFLLSKWFDDPSGTTLVSGKADGAAADSVYRLDAGLTPLVPGFTVESTLRLNGRFYGIVGKYNGSDVDPAFKGKKVMIVLDSTTWKATVVKATAAFTLHADDTK